MAAILEVQSKNERGREMGGGREGGKAGVSE